MEGRGGLVTSGSSIVARVEWLLVSRTLFTVKAQKDQPQ